MYFRNLKKPEIQKIIAIMYNNIRFNFVELLGLIISHLEFRAFWETDKTFSPCNRKYIGTRVHHDEEEDPG